ncbi:MAG: HD family phosphohydrolase [Clostridia bacterium]|nr:HD family phosphohydrolase [Clostridia bacterium]
MSKLYETYCKAYRLNDKNDEGFFDVVGDIYNSDEVQSLKQYEQHLEIDRLQHITSVSFVAYVTCKKFGLDYRSAAVGAVMHDLFYYDWRDGETGKWHRLHGYKHPNYAALNAKELFPEITKKETDIIRSHMWPLTLRFPKSKEGLIVSLSDKYCATRELLYSLNKKYRERFLRDLEGISYE